MLREEYVFGPIFSRRLGNSLGINILPRNGKLCNFDCVYCECGLNKEGLSDRKLPDVETIRTLLESRLKECVESATPIDSITFAGDGEPTLHPDFAGIVEAVLELRDKYFPETQVSVLTNATKIWKEDVFAALRKVDNPILKLDAPTDELAEKINCPVGEYSVERVVEGMSKFEGDFILQTMFMKMEGFDSSSTEVLTGWMNIVRKLHPRLVMAYTIARKTAVEGIEKISGERMKSLLAPLIEEGYNIQIND